MKIRSKEQGFTLIELLLVVVIIGIMLAVIVPRAWRANIDAKYGNVRQNASELASVAVQWTENQMEGQDRDSDAQLVSYLAYIAGGSTSVEPDASAGEGGTPNQWIADPDALGWQDTGTGLTGRSIGGEDDEEPSGPAKEMMPIDRRASNPFNGIDVFEGQNYPGNADSAIPGAIASGWAVDAELGDGWYYFGFRFQGTDNTDTEFAEEADLLHADMNNGTGGSGSNALNSLRSGIFMARAQFVDVD